MINKQDFFNAINQDIDMVRGDTLAFNFELQGLEGATPAIIFSCAESPNETALFTSEIGDGIELLEYDAVKDISTYSLRVDPNKTKSLDVARYYYDLEMRLDGDVITLMRGRLSLLYEVTKQESEV